MDQSGECQVSPSDMLISPKWGFLLSVLLLVNLSLVAWAAAFVPDQRPAAGSPRTASPPVPVTAPPVVSHQPVPGVALAEAVVPAVEVPNSPPPAAETAAPTASNEEPAPIVSSAVEWAPEPQSEATQPEPRESATPATTTQPSEVPAGLVVINPPSTGGAVHFLLAEEVITLQPGEFHVVAEIDERVVKFDRGGDFGQVEQKVSGEVWMFAVGSRGWHFRLVDRERAARHLEGCRPRSIPAEPATSEP
jgi:hypothetical protein